MSVPQKIGRYEILEEIGRGAMGAVYKARDPNIGRVVAIKTILASALTGPMADEYRMRFLREARAAGNLAHPGIVTVFDVDEHQGTSFLVMEFVQGRTLASALDVGERFPFSSIYDLGGQVADALGYAHAHGVVHRDVKPANILLTAAPGGKPDSMAKIADFGVAKLSSSQITTVQQMLGTPAFMSPEQCTGSPLDGRSDLFSLGVILYWMATGDKPFVGETLTALSYKIVHTEPIPPRALNPGIPGRLEQIILKALAKSPDTRYAAGVELALDLRALADPGTIRARVPEPPERHARPDDETTPLLGQRRPSAPSSTAPTPPPKAPAFEAETVAHRQPPREPRPPLAPPQHHPPQPPTRFEPEPPRARVETPSHSEPPPSHRTTPLPASRADRAWYEPESATRMLDAASRPAAQDSFIRHQAPRAATHTPRSYTRIILALVAVLSVAVLTAIFWPRPQAPAPDQAAANIASSQPNPASQPGPQTTAPSRDPSTPVEPSSSQPESLQPPAPMPSGPVEKQPAPPSREQTVTPQTADRVARPPSNQPRGPSQISAPSRPSDAQPAPASTPTQPAPRTVTPKSSAPPPQKQSQPSAQPTAQDPSQTDAQPSTTSASAPPPKAPATAPATSPDPAPATKPAASTGTPAKSAPSRPSLTAGQNPAKLRIIALTVPNEMDFILHDGSVVILSRPANARPGSRDILEIVDVPSGPRTLQVTLRIPSAGRETTKVARQRLKPSGTHLLEIEVRGVGNAGRPRFDIKLN